MKKLFSYEDVLRKAQQMYGIIESRDDSIYTLGILRRINRYAKDKFGIKVSSADDAVLSQQQVDYIINEGLKFYFYQVANELTNKDLGNVIKKEIIQEFIKEDQEMDELNLSYDEYYFLKGYYGDNDDYLRIEELKTLNKKGLVLYTSLSNEELIKIRNN